MASQDILLSVKKEPVSETDSAFTLTGPDKNDIGTDQPTDISQGSFFDSHGPNNSDLIPVSQIKGEPVSIDYADSDNLGRDEQLSFNDKIAFIKQEQTISELDSVFTITGPNKDENDTEPPIKRIKFNQVESNCDLNGYNSDLLAAKIVKPGPKIVKPGPSGLDYKFRPIIYTNPNLDTLPPAPTKLMYTSPNLDTSQPSILVNIGITPANANKTDSSNVISPHVLSRPVIYGTTDDKSKRTWVAKPEQNVAVPKQIVALPKENVILPKRNVALPKKSVFLPKKNVFLPKQNLIYLGPLTGAVVNDKCSGTMYVGSCPAKKPLDLEEEETIAAAKEGDPPLDIKVEDEGGHSDFNENPDSCLKRKYMESNPMGSVAKCRRSNRAGFCALCNNQFSLGKTYRQLKSLKKEIKMVLEEYMGKIDNEELFIESGCLRFLEGLEKSRRKVAYYENHIESLIRGDTKWSEKCEI